MRELSLSELNFVSGGGYLDPDMGDKLKNMKTPVIAPIIAHADKVVPAVRAFSFGYGVGEFLNNNTRIQEGVAIMIDKVTGLDKVGNESTNKDSNKTGDNYSTPSK